MKIGIVGIGVVGNAHKFGFEKLGHDVSFHDIAYDTKLEDVMDTEVVYICVPTPSAPDGQCDTSIVEEVVRDLVLAGYSGVIAIKSTVKPGTTQEMCIAYNTHQICFCPEFLRERSAETDFIEKNTLLAIGTEDDEVYNTVKKSHGDYPQKYAKLSPTEAELVKYYSNVYNAMRVIFANSIYEICEKLDADYDRVRDAFVKRGTATGQYTLVNKNWRGYAGVCLPKDTKALAGLVNELGLDLKIFETIDKENDKFIATVPEGMRL
jgi:UDPglucose 6-dehydrogenase